MATFNYSFSEKFYMGYCLILTKIVYRTCRLIRRPIVIRGKKYIDFGHNLTTGRSCQFEVAEKHNEKCLIFGSNVNIGHYVRIQCANNIHIGSNVLIGSRVTIIDHSHGLYKGINCDSPYTPPNVRELSSSPIIICDNVWIGEGAVIQQGVTIGRGSIIGANSVVSTSIPEGCIAGGVPARIIKKYDQDVREWIRAE